MRTSQVDKGLRTISGTQMSYNQKVPVFQVPFCHIDRFFVNYNDGTLSVADIEDTLEVYHPDISPDGKHVAFCTLAIPTFITTTLIY